MLQGFKQNANEQRQDTRLYCEMFQTFTEKAQDDFLHERQAASLSVEQFPDITNILDKRSPGGEKATAMPFSTWRRFFSIAEFSAPVTDVPLVPGGA